MKKKLILFTVAAIIFGCGQRIEHKYSNYLVQDDKNGFGFDGYYYLDGGDGSLNCIYFDQVAEAVTNLDSDCQSLVSVNPKNSTLGQFPTITGNSLVIIDGKIRFTRNYNYNSGHDLEEDINGSNITGTRRTDVLIEHENGKLKLTIKIYDSANNSNLNEVVATRVFKEV